jgi:hypothetical protein
VDKEENWYIIIFVAIVYGVWFYFVDSIAYCENPNSKEDCPSYVPIGEIFGDNNNNI